MGAYLPLWGVVNLIIQVKDLMEFSWPIISTIMYVNYYQIIILCKHVLVSIVLKVHLQYRKNCENKNECWILANCLRAPLLELGDPGFKSVVSSVTSNM